MDYLELFKIIKDNRVFDDMGTMFFVVDQTLQIHFINFEAVSQNQKMCIGVCVVRGISGSNVGKEIHSYIKSIY